MSRADPGDRERRDQDLVADDPESRLAGSLEREVELYGPPRSVLALRVLPTSSDESTGAVVVIVDDVTRERQLQEIRRSFVANVSHELRTPVGAIAVLAETLAATEDPRDDRATQRAPVHRRPPAR